MEDKEVFKMLDSMDAEYIEKLKEKQKEVEAETKRLHSEYKAIDKEHDEFLEVRRRTFHIYRTEDLTMDEAYKMAQMRIKMGLEDIVPKSKRILSAGLISPNMTGPFDEVRVRKTSVSTWVPKGIRGPGWARGNRPW